MKKFWNWKSRTVTNSETQEQTQERTLFLNGTIAEESWFDDDVTPQLFKDELMSGSGNITVWINSPGGDCVAAAQIYNMLMDYKGDVTVKIDGIAASAASVIAMAGTKVLVSPVSMLMIHNPMTAAFGNSDEMQKAIKMLGSVKDSIINAYEIKTGLSRAKLSHLMDAETWMDANKAVELGFADEIMQRNSESEEVPKYYWLYRVKFGIPATNLATKGDSITFSTPTIEGTILRRNKADAGGKHPWKAEALEGDVTAATITNWYKEVYEPTYTTTPQNQG